jgi:anti-sigma factor ChrR (cupin superfamily)
VWPLDPNKALNASRLFRIVLSNIPWSEGRVPGIRVKAFWSDPATKWRAAMARGEPGAKLPRHKHIGDELLFMIEGSNFDDSGELQTGNAANFPNGCMHTVVSKIGRIAIAFTTGEVEMAEDCDRLDAPSHSF